MSFAGNLKRIRCDLNISQSLLSRLSGVPASSISHFEKGNREPSMSSLVAISNALSCSTDALLGISNDISLVNVIDRVVVSNSGIKGIALDMSSYYNFKEHLKTQCTINTLERDNIDRFEYRGLSVFRKLDTDERLTLLF